MKTTTLLALAPCLLLPAAGDVTISPGAMSMTAAVRELMKSGIIVSGT